MLLLMSWEEVANISMNRGCHTPAELSLPWCGVFAPVLQIGAGDTYRMKTAAKPQTPVSMRRQRAPSSCSSFWRGGTVYDLHWCLVR